MGLLPRNYIIGMIIFGFFLLGGISLFVSFGINNDSQVTEFNNTFNKLDSLTLKANQIRNTITNASTDFGAFGVLNALISSAWNGLGYIYDIYDITNTMFIDLSEFFGIPVWIPLTLIIIALISICFAIWGAIFQKEI